MLPGRLTAWKGHDLLIDALAAMQLSFEERAFTPQEALQAAEAFVTASSLIVMPVVMIDGQLVGDGKPGKYTGRLREEFHRFAMFS